MLREKALETRKAARDFQSMLDAPQSSFVATEIQRKIAQFRGCESLNSDRGSCFEQARTSPPDSKSNTHSSRVSSLNEG